ncbi:unnamed protein product [Gongylonema pulchrum]|uniref:Uncharacterized protein n=1 Tax=Gongylonema pulchrum TaxID=637853 RepID=A0A3P7NDV8_9BILA|nr:unnamed protein product [Gongylonema pulchrum]
MSKDDISRVLENFARRPLVRELSEQNNVNRRMFYAAYKYDFFLTVSLKSFRNYCLNSSPLDPCIAVTISDILNKARDVDSIYPYFIEHARRVYPHLDCEKELKVLSDLSKPHHWYPKAREVFRKIHFHAGPTNSGKTYEALQRFYEAKTGFYCGPLRLLANEVAEKSNERGALIHSNTLFCHKIHALSLFCLSFVSGLVSENESSEFWRNEVIHYMLFSMGLLRSKLMMVLTLSYSLLVLAFHRNE